MSHVMKQKSAQLASKNHRFDSSSRENSMTVGLRLRVQVFAGGGGGGMRSPGLAKNAGKCGKNAENAAKNAIENAVLLEWCLSLKTPMFCLVLHNWALKAWTVRWNNLVQ